MATTTLLSEFEKYTHFLITAFLTFKHAIMKSIESSLYLLVHAESGESVSDR